MTLLTAQRMTTSEDRSYAVQVPGDPPRALVPAIIVFHGGGQDPENIALRWGVSPGAAPPAPLRDYLLVFPSSDPRLGKEWVHFGSGNSGFPTLDLGFVADLVTEITTPGRYPTPSPTVPTVSADPDLLYVAGFSNGGGMVWQVLYSDLARLFRGFAAVGKALDPEKVEHYQQAIGPASPAAAPVVYVQGTADRGYRPPFTVEETPLDETLPFFTVRELLTRNGIAAGTPATTRLIPGSTGVTEVVEQLYVGTAAFLQVTVLNGGHNWPTPTTRGNPPVATHYDATEAIVRFWRDFAGLP